MGDNFKEESLKEEQELILKNIRDESKDSGNRLSMKKSIIDHISSNNEIIFNNIHKRKEDLSEQEKRLLTEELLDRDYGLFLAKFGNYLSKEHLCYFENRNEEESVIVDLHLTQLKKSYENRSSTEKSSLKNDTCDDPQVLEMELAFERSQTEKNRLDLKDKLLDHLSLSKDAHFKSQQIGEPDLNQAEKRKIAENVLKHSPGLFLARFGIHLLEEHLDYFDTDMPSQEAYEVSYHIKQLRKNHCRTVTKVGIKNRRFEALKKMVEEGSYFCESEMRNRNPLLYEQLVGRFLTPDERRERIDNIDTTNITFVNLLLEQMDRENIKKLKKEQEDEEDNAMEEEDGDELVNGMEAEDCDSDEDNHLDKTLWGEELTDGESSASKYCAKKNGKKVQERRNEERIEEMSDAEKKLLLEEFRSNMFSNFLQGKDADFDYSGRRGG
ncbi:uncharacterized protein LOC128982953 isoform X2 [Macrosteles quadrilineatus]|uniref:uncharacterized protein LOC128982953 isoform X2 n=1 Tax=Macrosteles quadrilineatus TaxID=74068 RepID=UPI0023E2376A|nr:uncharacterized protein LOC128982953 isoform X2 [Macrosteles quadrilineatus]